jgi:hypothetical protein
MATVDLQQGNGGNGVRLCFFDIAAFCPFLKQHRGAQVIRHQNIGVQDEGVAPLNIFKQSPKATAVIGVSENRLLLIATADDVVKSSGKMDARASSHAVPLTPHSDNIKQPKRDTGYDTGYGGEYDEGGRLADSFNDSL